MLKNKENYIWNSIHRSNCTYQCKAELNSFPETVCSLGPCAVSSSGSEKNRKTSVQGWWAALTQNFGPRRRSAVGGLKSLLPSRWAPTYISMLHIGLLDNESRASVWHRDPRPPLPSHSPSPHPLAPLRPRPLGGQDIWFGVFPDVCHVAEQSITGAMAGGQL